MSYGVAVDFEKLGAFYLGRRYDPTAGLSAEPLLYDAADLTTHAVCVGMTGSGKTGLCLSLLEEAAIDGVPAICIDPKGDLGNLLLGFPKLDAASFEPWIDPGDAARRGQTVAQRAAAVANQWKQGLAEWGQDGQRIRRLHESVEMRLYTPGSDAGLGLSLMRSLAAPQGLQGDALTERITAAVSGLLSRIGEDTDPMQSPAYVFLSSVLEHAWSQGQSLELGDLVRVVMDPPIARVGVLDLDTFFPAKARQALAMKINGLLASPGFASWLRGEPLDAQRLLWSPEGKPRVSILNIAHLSDAERMFFVTALLNEVVGWMRSQPGTSSLRAILYMDEVFGFLPPVANPPSKHLLLTLLKQARAYGLGLVLATQNPVDIDYKALSNCGTWLLGRLQTERDVDRVIDGLQGAAQASGRGLDEHALRAQLAGLKSRVFLMNNVHDTHPVLFHTRWALSYLRGPLTRAQIRALTSASTSASTSGSAPADAPKAPRASAPMPTNRTARPVVEADLPEVFLGQPVGDFTYEPCFLATIRIHYDRRRPPVDAWRTLTLLAPVATHPADVWTRAERFDGDTIRRHSEPAPGATWTELPRGALAKRKLASVASKLKRHVYRTEKLRLYRCKAYRLSSEAGESRDAFVARLRQVHREERDRELAKVRAAFEKKHEVLLRKVRRAEQKLAREQAQVKEKQMDTALSVGTAVLGALFGRRTTLSGHAGRAAAAARRGSQALKEKRDVELAEASLAELRAEVEALEEELTTALAEVQARFEALPEVEEVEVAAKKADIEVAALALAWRPRP